MEFIARIIYRKTYKEISEQLDLIEKRYQSAYNRFYNCVYFNNHHSGEPIIETDKQLETSTEELEQIKNIYTELEQLHNKQQVGFSKFSKLEERYQWYCDDIWGRCSKIEGAIEKYKSSHCSMEFLAEFWGNGNQIPLYPYGYDKEYSKENHYNATCAPKDYGVEKSFKTSPYKPRINLNDDTKTQKTKTGDGEAAEKGL